MRQLCCSPAPPGESGNVAEQMQRQKKLVADCLDLTARVRKTADTDVSDVPTPRSSGVHVVFMQLSVLQLRCVYGCVCVRVRVRSCVCEYVCVHAC